MAVDNTFVVKKLRNLETFCAAYSHYTRMPYVECDQETFDDQVYLFGSEALARTFAEDRARKGVPLVIAKITKQQTPGFVVNLYAIGVTAVIFEDRSGVSRLPIELLDEIIPRPDQKTLAEQKLPVMNPGLQLTVLYFLQELRKAGLPTDPARVKQMKELEEEMVVNLIRSQYLLPYELLDPAPGMDPQKTNIRIVYAQNKDGDLFQPLFSDLTELRKCYPDPRTKLRVKPVSFAELLPHLNEKAKGYVLNQKGFNLVLTRGQIERINSQYE